MNKKWIFLCPSFLFPLSIVACSKSTSSNSTNSELISVINNFISDNKGNFNSFIIDLNPNLNGSNKTKNINLFKILLNEDWKYNNNEDIVLDDVFNVDSNKLNKLNIKGYNVLFEFEYSVQDSFGNVAKPYVSSNKEYIVVPVLLTIYDSSQGQSMSKYIDLFSLKIVNTIVNNMEDYGFNNTNGKTLVFNNDKFNNVQFQDIPNFIIDNYLTFNLIGTSSGLRRPVRYPNPDYDFSKWKNKTLSEVKALSNSIQSPLDFRTKDMLFSYNLLDSYFDQNEPKYAGFNIEFRWKNENNNSLIDSASKHYGLIFYKRYSYVDTRWEFKLPNSNDIESAKNKNSSIASSIVDNLKEIDKLYLPIVNMSYNDVKQNGVENIIKRFDRNKNDFLPSKGFDYIVLDDVRKIWFEIISLESVNDEKDKIKVNISLNVGENKLKGSASFSKTFDTSIWKWEM